MQINATLNLMGLVDKRSKLPLGGAADRGGVVEGEQKGGARTAPAEGPGQAAETADCSEP